MRYRNTAVFTLYLYILSILIPLVPTPAFAQDYDGCSKICGGYFARSDERARACTYLRANGLPFKEGQCEAAAVDSNANLSYVQVIKKHDSSETDSCKVVTRLSAACNNSALEPQCIAIHAIAGDTFSGNELDLNSDKGKSSVREGLGALVYEQVLMGLDTITAISCMSACFTGGPGGACNALAILEGMHEMIGSMILAKSVQDSCGGLSPVGCNGYEPAHINTTMFEASKDPVVGPSFQGLSTAEKEGQTDEIKEKNNQDQETKRIASQANFKERKVSRGTSEGVPFAGMVGVPLGIGRFAMTQGSTAAKPGKGKAQIPACGIMVLFFALAALRAENTYEMATSVENSCKNCGVPITHLLHKTPI